MATRLPRRARRNLGAHGESESGRLAVGRNAVGSGSVTAPLSAVQLPKARHRNR